MATLNEWQLTRFKNKKTKRKSSSFVQHPQKSTLTMKNIAALLLYCSRMQVRLFLSSHVLTMVTFCVYSSDIWETYIHSCTKAPPINVFAWLTEPCPLYSTLASTILWCCCTTQFLEILFEPFNTIFCSMFAHDSFSKLNNNVLHLTSISALDVYKMRETMKEWRDLTIPIPKLDSIKMVQW